MSVCLEISVKDPNLDLYADSINKLWKEHSNKIISELMDFFDIAVPEVIPIDLVYSAEKGGGEVSENQKIILRVNPGRPPIRVFEVFTHELIHYAEACAKRRTRIFLMNLGISDGTKASLIDESILGWFAPYALLSEKLKISDYKIWNMWSNPNILKPNQKARWDVMKLIEKESRDYFKKCRKQSYEKDFLPRIAELVKSQQIAEK